MAEQVESMDQQPQLAQAAKVIGWRQTTVLTGVVCATLLALFYQTTISMVSIWWRSETFAHGFFILPISLFLIWRLRDELSLMTPQPTYWGLPLMALLGFGWLLAHFASVTVVQQLALVGMLQVAVFSLLGWQVTKKILFPLFFLLFAVPMGEGLIPPLMDFTANFTVKMLQITGIPVFKEGTFFEIPSGRWSVVEGCSGVRYLIASVTLGCLYAYLSYRSLSRRLIFVAASFVVPVFANGFRAYLIVMIAHLSDMKLALGIDHFIYGWVWFAIVITAMFWIGSYWREEPVESGEELNPKSPNDMGVSAKATIAVASAVVAVAVIWPAWGMISESSFNQSPVVLSAPESANAGWRKATEPLTDWHPFYQGMDAQLAQTYVGDGDQVGLYLAYYRYQRQDAELVNSQNVLIPQKHPVWRQTSRKEIAIKLNGEPYQIQESFLKSADQNLLVWRWYWLAGHHTTNDYEAKVREALAKLFATERDSAGIVIYTQMGETPDNARVKLQRYLDDMLPAIEKTLTAAMQSVD